MQALLAAVGVGIVIVLPQAVGLVAARAERRHRAVAWALGAAGTVAVFWASTLFSERHPSCSTGSESLVCAFLLAGHFVLGSILGTLDQRAHRY